MNGVVDGTAEAGRNEPPRLPGIGWAVIFTALIALIVGGIVVAVLPRPAASLERLAPAPHFSLTDQDGKPFSSDELKGKVWVADFIFTRCPGPCPIMTAHLAELSRKLGPTDGDVRLVTISVDPTYDTPAVLKEYSERVGASSANWKFLNGSEEAVKQVVTKGFLQALGKNGDGTPMHSTRFVLVDRNGIIRAFPDGNEPGIAGRLYANIQSLLHE